jgi:hypothetical protein
MLHKPTPAGPHLARLLDKPRAARTRTDTAVGKDKEKITDG